MPSGPIIGGDGTLTISGPLGIERLEPTASKSRAGRPGFYRRAMSMARSRPSKRTYRSPSVVGRDDGQAWGWAVQTNSPACGSPTRAASTSTPTTATEPRRWGIVLRRGGRAGQPRGVDGCRSSRRQQYIAVVQPTLRHWLISPAILIDPRREGHRSRKAASEQTAPRRHAPTMGRSPVYVRGSARQRYGSSRQTARRPGAQRARTDPQ